MNRVIKTFWLIFFLFGCSSAEATIQPQLTTLAPDEQESEPVDVTNTPSPSMENGTTLTTESQISPTHTLLPDKPTSTTQNFPVPQPLTSGQAITVTLIQMFDPLKGWGVGYQEDSGDHVLYTEDGGLTWLDRTPPDTIANQPDEIGSLTTHFLDSEHGWAIYSSGRIPPALQSKIIWRTSDSGLTWEPSNPLEADGMEDAYLPRGFTSISLQEGWLLVHVGGGMSHDYSYLYQTGDGGITWDRIVDPYSGGIQGLRNTGIAFANENYGWVSKENLGVMPGAFLEQTRDGGRNWERVFLPNPPELDWFNEFSLCETSQPTFTTEQEGIMIVRCRLPDDLERDITWSYTFIYRTNNRGDTWEFSKLPTPVHQLLFINEKTGWAFGQDLYRTTDGGSNWEMYKIVNWDGSFTFISSEIGWAVARNEAEIALVATIDGGQTWQIIEPIVR